MRAAICEVFITSVYIAAISAGGAIAMAQGKDAITKGDSYKLNESYSWAGPPWSGARLRNKRRGTRGGNSDTSFTVLTWNSGGGQPTPEYLGGAWEHDLEGMFGEIEKLTGAMLFHIGKCSIHHFGTYGETKKMEDFPKGTDFEKFKFRYAEAWKELQGFIKNNGNDIKNFMGTITPQKLLEGLPKVAKRDYLPKWTTACTIDFIIGNKGVKGGPSTGLALCPILHDRKDDDKADAAKCKFDLSNEACFPLRDGLPVYGAKFMKLMELDSKEDPKEYWEKYTGSLLTKQDSWPAKGCKQDTKSTDPLSTPDKYMRLVLKPKYESTGGTDSIEKSQYAPFTYEKWTQVAAWDKLVIRIARFAAEKILGERLEEVAGGMKHIVVMPKDEPPKVIKKLVESAATKMGAKVIFLQEGEKMDINGFHKSAATADTAVYIKEDFAQIDEARTKAAEGMWAKMVEEIKKEEKNIFPAAMSVVTPAKLRPAQLAKMVVDKDEGIEKTKWVSAKKLETIVVTDKGLMLISIHADGDGYWCAQYLHVAKKLYDQLATPFGLKSMIIGMDTNVQPDESHLAFAKDKGLEFEQLKAAIPKEMVLIEPKERTVLKVRTFLQTQFGKIGKNDDVKKDMFFLYKGTGAGATPAPTPAPAPALAEVLNMVVKDKGEETFIYDPDDLKYFPKNEWPVDHFMVYHKVSADMAETDLAPLTDKQVADAKKLQTTFANEVVEELKTAKTETKPTLDTLAAEEAAKKPKKDTKKEEPAPKEKLDENSPKAKVLQVIKNRLHRRDERLTVGPNNKKHLIKKVIEKLEKHTGTHIPPELEKELIKDVKDWQHDEALKEVEEALGKKHEKKGGDVPKKNDKDSNDSSDIEESDGGKSKKGKEKGCRVIRAVLARTIGPNGARVKAAFHNMREKIRAMNPLRKPKVAKTATASVTKPPSFAMKVKKSMSNLTSKAEHMIQRIFGRETDGGEEEEEA